MFSMGNNKGIDETVMINWLVSTNGVCMQILRFYMTLNVYKKISTYIQISQYYIPQAGCFEASFLLRSVVLGPTMFKVLH